MVATVRSQWTFEIQCKKNPLDIYVYECTNGSYPTNNALYLRNILINAISMWNKTGIANILMKKSAIL